MKVHKRWTSLLLCIGSLVLVFYFVGYRVLPVRMCPGTHDVVCSTPDMIVPLGLTTIEPAPGSLLAKYNGKTGAERVIVAQHGYSPLLAGILGIVIPAILFVQAMLLFRAPKKRN